MEKFRYRARDITGRIHKGKIEAESLNDALGQLKARGYYPVRISPVNEYNFSFNLKSLSRIKSKDLILFSLQLSTMLNAGMSLTASLEALSAQIKNTRFRETLLGVKTELENGHSFSDALGKHPEIFSTFFLNIVRAGEEGGNLDLVLERYSQFMERKEETLSQIKTALTYPAILTVLGLGVVIFSVVYIIPKITDIIVKSNVELPAATLIMMKLSLFIRNYYHVLLFSLATAIFSVKMYISTEKGGYYFDRFKLMIPILGSLFSKTAISHMMRTMSTLLASGVPFLKNIRLVREVVGNRVFYKKLENMQVNISKGEGIARQFAGLNIFPPMVVQMIAIGEESGSLDVMLEKVADFYDREVEYHLKRIVSLIEPLMIIIMALMVGFIALSLISAIMKAVTTF